MALRNPIPILKVDPHVLNSDGSSYGFCSRNRRDGFRSFVVFGPQDLGGLDLLLSKPPCAAQGPAEAWWG